MEKNCKNCGKVLTSGKIFCCKECLYEYKIKANEHRMKEIIPQIIEYRNDHTVAETLKKFSITGATLKKYNIPGKRWTEEQKNLFKKMWSGEYSKEEIMESFPGRQWRTLIGRAFDLNVRRPKYFFNDAKKNIEQIPDAYISWLAGIIDGEGTIGAYNHPDGFVVSLIISNNYFPILYDVLQKVKTGGIFRRDFTEDNHVQNYIFKTSDKPTIIFLLKRLKKYLRVKHQQAMLMIDMLDEEIEGVLSKDREIFYIKMFRIFNSRGTSIKDKDVFSEEYKKHNQRKNNKKKSILKEENLKNSRKINHRAVRWSKEESDKFKELWENEPNIDKLLSFFPNRTYQSLSGRAIILNLHRPKYKDIDKLKFINAVPECFFAWFAGFFDGEGCVSVSKGKKNRFCLSVVASNTYYPVIYQIYRIINCGGIYKNNRNKENQLTSYSFSTNDRLVGLTILEKIYPYLTVKKERVLLAINFLKKEIYEYLSSEEIEEFIKLFKKLNARGSCASSQDPYRKEYEEYNKNREVK